MLRQTISSTSRALRATARLGAQRQITLRAQHFQTPLAAVRATAPRIRWYSSETEAAKEEPKKEEPEKEEQKEESKEESKKAEGEAESVEATLRKQLEAKDAEIRDLKDMYLRSVADFRNLQDRTQRDMKAARDFAIQNFAKDLVESVDNLDRALSMVPAEKLKAEGNQELVNLYEGLRMTEKILLQTLKKHGLERFDPINEPFNPNEHEATFMTAMEGKENNTVCHTQQTGFKLNGRILRPAKVGVVKNK